MTPSRALDLRVRGLGTVLRLTDCPEVLETLGVAMPAWPLRALPATGPAPAIRVRREGNGFLQRSPDFPRGLYLPTPVSAACSLVAELVGAFQQRHPESIGLHCGAVEIEGHLVVFPESHRAGKSLLIAAFAAAGERVFGDDVLALTAAGEGMALGIAPRLRLPLPASLAPELAVFAEHHAGAEDGRYRYLALPKGSLAPHGACLPLGALVLLERDDSIVEPELVSLAPGEGLIQLLCQNFAHRVPSEALMARFLPPMASLPCLLLRYGEPLAAARELIAELPEKRESRRPATVSLTRHHRARGGERQSLPGVWAAGSGVHAYTLGEELFLIHQPSGGIHRLNETGRAIWLLLTQAPLSVREIADLLAEHYAGMAVESIEPDVAALMRRLADAGLIRHLDDGA